MYYVYLIKDERSRIYFGSTNNLRRRIKEHNSGQTFSTSNHTWKLIYYEAYVSAKDARQREQSLKAHGQALRRLKERIIDSLMKVSAG